MVNCLTEGRFGIVEIQDEFLKNTPNEDLKMVFDLLGIIVRTDFSIYNLSNKYIFSRPDLARVPIGKPIPRYRIIIDKLNKTAKLTPSDVYLESGICPMFRNKKSKKIYMVLKTGINATNKQDGQVMVEYYAEHDVEFENPFYREINEFMEKFEEINDTTNSQDSDVG